MQNHYDWSWLGSRSHQTDARLDATTCWKNLQRASVAAFRFRQLRRFPPPNVSAHIYPITCSHNYHSLIRFESGGCHKSVAILIGCGQLVEVQGGLIAAILIVKSATAILASSHQIRKPASLSCGKAPQVVSQSYL